MGRTNIDIDDDLIGRVMRVYRLPTKRAAVDYALRRLAAEPMTREQALAMQGAGWHGDIEAIFGSDDVPGDLATPDGSPKP